MNKKSSDLGSKDAEAMTQEDWESLDSSKSDLEKIAEKIKNFFQLFDTQELYSNVEEVRESFMQAFETLLKYPKPLESFNLHLHEGKISFSGSVLSPIYNLPILFKY